MPPRRRARSKRRSFKLKFKQLRRVVDRSLKQAEQAVKVGESAVKTARQRQDARAVTRNTKTLRDARVALRKLKTSLSALQDACCDQFLNCDPGYE